MNPSSRTPRRRTPRPAARAALRQLVALAVLALVSACQPPPPPARDTMRPVRAMTLGDTSSFSSRSFPGRAEATREVNLAFEVPGRLVERPVKVGDRVAEDALLARLDPRDFRNALDASLARLAQAEAYRDRIAQAAESGAVAKQDLTDAQAAYDVAAADVAIREKALADTELLAPFPGTIAAVFVENFQNVLAKQMVVRLLDTSQVEMTVDVPEALISNVPYVREVWVEFDAFPGQPVQAEITDVGNEATMATRTYPVTVGMDQPEGFTILPGMAGVATGRAELPEDDARLGLEVPAAALAEVDGATGVWILEAAGDGTYTARRQPVELGDLTGRGVRVRGVEPGQVIATAGVHTLVEGQRVRLLEDDAP